MQDRVPLYPGRVKLTPVSGQENTYDMVRADEPTQEGDQLCKETLLKDETAARFGLPNTAVPNDVFSMLLCPQIIVTTPSVSEMTGSTVTCKNGTTVLTADEVEGTWTFNVPDYGYWTVTATKGDKSVTKKVLVDVVGVYEIEMDYKLWLYRDGEQYNDITGGWVQTTSGNYYGNNLTGTVTFNSDNIYVYCNGYLAFCNTSNKIDLSEYQTLKVEYENSIGGKGQYADRRVIVMLASQVGIASLQNYILKTLRFGTGSGSIALDVSSISESAYVAFMTESDAGIRANIKKVWLE